jgi:hypothetical protein
VNGSPGHASPGHASPALGGPVLGGPVPGGPVPGGPGHAGPVNGDGGAAAAGGQEAQARSGGFGLAGIAERVASCGGHLSVGPTGAGGFAVTARLPAQ